MVFFKVLCQLVIGLSAVTVAAPDMSITHGAKIAQATVIISLAAK